MMEPEVLLQLVHDLELTIMRLRQQIAQTTQELQALKKTDGEKDENE